MEKPQADGKIIALLEELLDRFKLYPRGYAVARCPFHPDAHPSLFVDPQTGYFHCKACKETGGLAKLIAQVKKLSIPEAKELLKTLRIGIEKPRKEVEAEYFYTNEHGFVLYKVVRYKEANGGKSFSFFHYDVEREEWRPGKGDYPDVLYDLPSVIEAETVLITEGEKCAEALKKYGFTATTNPSGAGSWRPEFARWLEGKTIFLMPDNDPPGVGHMREVGFSLEGKAKAIYWVDLSALVEEKGDIADLLEKWEQEEAPEDEIRRRIEELLQKAEPFNPDKFSLLGELTLKPENLEHARAEFLIEGFIPRQALILITAKFGGGKSLSALALAKKLITNGERILYLDLDNPLPVVSSRLKKADLLSYLGERLFYISRSTCSLDYKAETWKALRRELKKQDHLVIIVDTLKNFSRGAELNADKDMGEVMAELMELRDAGHTVLVLHHLPKRVDGENPYKNSTTVADTVDVAFFLRKEGERLIFENFKDRIAVRGAVIFKINEHLDLEEALTPRQEEDKVIAEVVLKFLPPEGRKQKDLVVAVSDHLKFYHEGVPCGEKRIVEVLNKFQGRLWEVIRLERNAKVYKKLVELNEFRENPSLYMGAPHHQTEEGESFEPSPVREAGTRSNGDGKQKEIDLYDLLRKVRKDGGEVGSEDESS